jgi:hypothetical protein
MAWVMPEVESPWRQILKGNQWRMADTCSAYSLVAGAGQAHWMGLTGVLRHECFPDGHGVHDLFFPRTARLAWRPPGNGRGRASPAFGSTKNSEMWAERAFPRRSNRATVGFSNSRSRRLM